jgi:hypothetical protein
MRRLNACGFGMVVAIATACGSGGRDVSIDRALVTACGVGDSSEVQRLIAAGADVDYRWTRFGRTRTPLSEAVHGRHTAVVEILERAGAQEW